MHGRLQYQFLQNMQGHACKSVAVPGSRIPEARASKTRLRASPGLMLEPPLLTHFSTRSSIAYKKGQISIDAQGWTVPLQAFTHPLVERRPCGNSLAQVPQNSNHHNTWLQSISPSLLETPPSREQHNIRPPSTAFSNIAKNLDEIPQFTLRKK